MVPNTNAIMEKEQNISAIHTIKGNWILKINKGSPEEFNTLLVSSGKNGGEDILYGDNIPEISKGLVGGADHFIVGGNTKA